MEWVFQVKLFYNTNQLINSNNATTGIICKDIVYHR